MPTLPQGGSLPPIVSVESMPSLTWYINKDTNRIQGTVDNYDAVVQAVQVILNVERFRWQIYSPYSGMQWRGLIGEDPGYVAAELQRRIRDALVMDDRVTGIKDFKYSIADDVLTASLTVTTVYGDVQTTTEVNIA
jgi:hypothetical protein